MKRALIISIKTAPGLPKEFFLIGNHLKSLGYNVEYLLNFEYDRFILPQIKEDNVIHFVKMSNNMVRSYFIEWKNIRQEIIRKCGRAIYDYICIYNPHPLCHRLMEFFYKKNPKSIRSVVLHEPYVPFKERYLYGLSGYIKILFLDYFSQLLLRNCTDVILPSKQAEKLYQMMPYKRQKLRTHIVPLLLTSEEERERKIRDNKYIAFVGTINKARDIKGLLLIADKIYQKWPNIKFRILTRQNINIKSKNIEVIKKDFILDDEISNFVQDSLALFLTHTVAAQSGNVPVAYRVGTPIICFNVEGITQHIDFGKTGYIIDKDNIELDFNRAIEYLINHEDEMRANCIAYFETVFSQKNISKLYEWLEDKKEQ
ncbi:glycosyltransferase [Bacillus benzoevorans]|uniref:Glycosyltransferase involved in cell wall biosynthesis n=1 Tax=Bacillus benzoevorans TaxID=1456 RepID=A0A7X0HXT1_9BACI|nr:glycosyltransferase [Bacillus benzoevorans]MBB6447576.1 glycosyltransferase involved in cell wall biosynthesis [Bacillus benzoevorans]